MQRSKLLLATTAMATLVALGGAASAQDRTAVNSYAELGFSVGNNDGADFQLVGGSYLFPTSGALNFQVDGILGRLDGDMAHGVAAHMFTRSSMGLVGLYAEASNAEVLGAGSLQRLALEGEYYLGSVTVAGLAGYQQGDLGEGAFGELTASLMLDNGFGVFGQYSYQPDLVGSIFTIGGSYHPTGTNMSVFADASYRERTDSYSAQVGVRFFFGGNGVQVSQNNNGGTVGGLVGSHFDLFVEAAASGANTDPDPSPE